MIKKFRSKALKLAFAGQVSKINPAVAPRIQQVLAVLDVAQSLQDLESLTGFHALSGDREGTFAVTITKNWRVTFELAPETVTDPQTGEETEVFNVARVDFEDYH